MIFDTDYTIDTCRTVVVLLSYEAGKHPWGYERGRGKP